MINYLFSHYDDGNGTSGDGNDDNNQILMT